MQLASEERIREILTTQFGVDIRNCERDGRKFSSTFEEGVPIIVCEWTNLPPGHTMNGSNIWWVRVWEKGQNIPADLQFIFE